MKTRAEIIAEFGKELWDAGRSRGEIMRTERQLRDSSVEHIESVREKFRKRQHVCVGTGRRGEETKRPKSSQKEAGRSEERRSLRTSSYEL